MWNNTNLFLNFLTKFHHWKIKFFSQNCFSSCICWMQALCSYVFIAANIILHSNKERKFGHLDELLPPIIPLLTSHHHTLRGFTQVSQVVDEKYLAFSFLFIYMIYDFCGSPFVYSQILVFQVLQKLLPGSDSGAFTEMSLEKKCFVDLRSYLANNLDCARYANSILIFIWLKNMHLSVYFSSTG